jgi:general secretion pathway protein G
MPSQASVERHDVRPGCAHLGSGFTLIEILFIVAISGVLAALSGTQYLAYVERARVAKAIAEIHNLAVEIEVWEMNNAGAPDSLAAAGITAPLDPWGNPYAYLKLIGPGPGTTMGQARKDQFLVPINSSFDLYSMGKDGETRPPLDNPRSKDDIVRAKDGGFIGLAERF